MTLRPFLATPSCIQSPRATFPSVWLHSSTMSTRDDSGDVGFHCHRLDDATNAFFDSIDAWKLDRTCDPAKGYFMELPDRIDAIIDQAARLKALRLACSGPPPHSYPPTDHENAHFGSRAATQSAVEIGRAHV